MTMNPDPAKAFILEIESHSYSIVRYEVFTDFVECFSISLRQPYLHDPKLEENYLRIFNSQKAYKALFPQLVHHTVDGLSQKPCDFLGEEFMRLELGNSARGQFFTPYEVSLLISKMTIPQTEKGLITEIADCACGAGGMLIAGAETLKEQHVNIHERLFAFGQDIDRMACNMCYIQLSLLGIPGVVVWGKLPFYRGSRTVAYALFLLQAFSGTLQASKDTKGYAEYSQRF